MCGVCGFVLTEPPDYEAEGILKGMCNRLVHRGPDEDGRWTDQRAWLGHRRLNIIDLDGGRQPIGNEDDSIQTVFNGELYNYQDLTERLTAKGHVFKTRTDTEILVHLWEELGTDLLAELVGMFGFALWDQRQRTLLLARDRMGQKPLYYTVTRQGIAFASELSSLMAHPMTSREIDPLSLRKYLLYDAVPSPHTMLKGVRKLEPGCWLTFHEGTVKEGRYWDITHPPKDDPVPSIHDAAGTFRSLLKESVDLRLMSEVPLGVFLSGGLDSSTVVALMREVVGQRPIETFSIGFENKSFDESPYAAQIANQFNCQHHHRELTPSTMRDILPRIMSRLDEPLADNSLLPTYLLSGFARERITVALGGDGGDELLLGYPTFQAHRIAGWYMKLPRFLRQFIESMVQRLPVSRDNISFDYKAKRFLKGLDYPSAHRHFVWIGAMAPDEQRPVLLPDVLDAANDARVMEDIDRHAARVAARDPWDLLSYLYAKIYMCDDILTKVDRASMMHSLEVRAPLLDHRVVEHITALPTAYKMKGLNMKYLLKQAMKQDLPRNIVKRPKKGFGVPIGHWLKGELNTFAHDLLSPESIRSFGFLDPRAVQNLLSEHESGVRDHRKPLWSIMVLLLWAQTWLEDSSRQESTAA